MKGYLKAKNKKMVCFSVMVLLISAVLIFGTYSLSAKAENNKLNFFDLHNPDEKHEGFFSMQDLATGDTVMRTARIMHVGDEYINQENYLFRVERIEGDIAWAQNLGKVKLSNFVAQGVSSSMLPHLSVLQKNQEPISEPTIGVYHSHGAEAYVPSDGVESIDEGGGILEVGEVFVQALRERGLKVFYTSLTHVPHDAGAYYRSRRTVEELLRKGTDAVFDVHRDAVPAEEYLAVVDSEEMVQIQFVVGRQNPNVQVNREYAESLKQCVDEQYPGLIKGIFMANGSYNQDLLPLSLLLEVGSHLNTKEGAKESMKLFADAVQFYYLGPQGTTARKGIATTALRTVLWVIFIAALAVGVYLLISTRSPEEARNKLLHFFQKEFAELRRKNKNGEDPGGQ
ncbi:MAG: stage II sporulation protein P [Dethiobacteria bacterium]